MQPPWQRAACLRWITLLVFTLVVCNDALLAPCDVVATGRRTCKGSPGGSRWQATRLYGTKEWRAGQPIDGPRRLGFLPFPVSDVMCPGETKAMHLYEARFLALFEDAIKNHGGCIGGALFVEDGVLVKVGQLCDIVAWEREKVGVSLAIRCVGRIVIQEIEELEPYIKATVVEMVDSVGEGKKESNAFVSSEVFSLHRRCREMEERVAAAEGKQAGPAEGDGALEMEIDVKMGGDKDDGGNVRDSDDVNDKFRRGGGELDLGPELDPDAVEPTEPEARPGVSAAKRVGTGAEAGKVREPRRLADVFAEVDEEEDDVSPGEDGDGQAALEDLMWGHEPWVPDGFETSLEEQVEERYVTLNADLLVTLDESGKRGGPDASVFGAADSSPMGSNGAAWGGVNTLAGLFAKTPGESAGNIFTETEAAGGAPGQGAASGVEDAEGEEFLWGCSTQEEERHQLVSYTSLGCFDPAARLQSLMIKSTGRRLRLARAALAEKLRILVAKSALSQLDRDNQS